jgi:hypothetical protein
VRVAGAVPYSRAAAASGPLVYVPAYKTVAATDVAGKVVVRDRAIFGGQQAVFFAVADYVHDPDLSLNYGGNYERDVSAYAGIIADLEQAAAGKAAGLVFAATVPHDQAFSYAPYHGEFFGVPALQVGVDEGEALKAAAGQVATVTVSADRNPNAPTRNVIATLKGQSDERIVFASHTDGMNAVWDNGPTAILALARYLSTLPLRCRPRTFEFGLTSAHLHQDVLGSQRYAEQLSRDYAKGTVALVITLEHLGALEYLAAPRANRPGVELRYTGKSEPFVTFSNESHVTKQALISSIVRRDLRRTWALRGADAPAATFPPHHSYGGEGGIYHLALLPTVAAITGPNTLFKPNYSLDDLLDVHLMRRQSMAFGDVALSLAKVPRKAIAGADLLYRRAHPATGNSSRAKTTPFYCDLYAAAAGRPLA